MSDPHTFKIVPAICQYLACGKRAGYVVTDGLNRPFSGVYCKEHALVALRRERRKAGCNDHGTPGCTIIVGHPTGTCNA